ncbi:hypothetical protein GQ42DRAFT_59803 [Ramicandelaber brevisporus]|nr:hypothetical protein GQ42DRAFT_59803 [Ramicandelaber brevisporus]
MQYKYRHMASPILQLQFKSTRQVANGTVALRSSSAAARTRGGLATRQLDVVHVVCANRLESGNIPTVECAVQHAAAPLILGGEHRASPRLRRWSEVHHHSAQHLRPAVCLLLATRSGLVRRRRPRDDLVHAADDGQDAGKVAVARCHCCRRGGSTAGADLLHHRQHHVHVEAPAQIGARRHRRHRSPRHIVVSRRRPAAPRRRKRCVEQP